MARETIARLAGGLDVTDATMALARERLAAAATGRRGDGWEAT